MPAQKASNKSAYCAASLESPAGRISLMRPEICACILANYSRLKEDSWDRFEDDTWYLIYDFEKTCD